MDLDKQFEQWFEEQANKGNLGNVDFPKMFEFGKSVWFICRQACADVCGEHASSYSYNKSLRVYTALECAKACQKIEKELRPEED